MLDLTTLGWDETRAEQFETFAADGLIPGRIAVQHRGAYDVLVEPGELRCDVAGRLYDESRSPADLPAVGDWVAVAYRPEEDAGTVQAILPRRTKFSRKTAWQAAEEQVLAANIDVVFVVTSLNEDLNLRRLERYLILARESGAQPVVLLTKSDLAADTAAALTAIESIACGRSRPRALERHGRGPRRGARLPPRRCHRCAPRLVGRRQVDACQHASRARSCSRRRSSADDGQGRHTTTRRELVQLPGGALVIDTPGMRELQLWVADEGLEETFDDVTSLFAHCRFADCRHESEPGCAVKEAIDDGTLAPRALGQLPEARGRARAPRAAARQAGAVRGAQALEGAARSSSARCRGRRGDVERPSLHGACRGLRSPHAHRRARS